MNRHAEYVRSADTLSRLDQRFGIAVDKVAREHPKDDEAFGQDVRAILTAYHAREEELIAAGVSA